MGGYIWKTDIDIAMEETVERENLKNIIRAIDKQHMDLEKALDYMDIPKEQRQKYVLKLREETGIEYALD